MLIDEEKKRGKEKLIMSRIVDIGIPRASQGNMEKWLTILVLKIVNDTNGYVHVGIFMKLNSCF